MCMSEPSDALRKQQLTMHIIFKARERADDRDGHTILICKGSANGRCTAIKKNGWNKKKSVKFQKSAWFDTAAAEEIAVEFAQFKKEKHGDAWFFCHWITCLHMLLKL